MQNVKTLKKCMHIVTQCANVNKSIVCAITLCMQTYLNLGFIWQTMLKYNCLLFETK